MNRSLIGIMIMVCLLISSVAPVSAEAKTFPDVPQEFWAYPYISELSSAGVIGGYRDGYFRPNQIITRQQAAAMLVSALELDIENRPTPTFVDMPSDPRMQKIIATVADEGILNGSGNRFRPGEPVNRAQMAAILSRSFAREQGGQYVLFRDVEEDHWARGPIVRVASNGIAGGYREDLTFRPSEATTRAQFSVFLVRALNEERRLEDLPPGFSKADMEAFRMSEPNLEYHEGWLYYSSSRRDEERGLYRVRYDLSEREFLAPIMGYGLQIKENHLYFYGDYWRQEPYKLDLRTLQVEEAGRLEHADGEWAIYREPSPSCPGHMDSAAEPQNIVRESTITGEKEVLIECSEWAEYDNPIVHNGWVYADGANERVRIDGSDRQPFENMWLGVFHGDFHYYIKSREGVYKEHLTSREITPLFEKKTGWNDFGKEFISDIVSVTEDYVYFVSQAERDAPYRYIMYRVSTKGGKPEHVVNLSENRSFIPNQRVFGHYLYLQNGGSSLDRATLVEIK
ncbi:S-layer homology domain-containing protein [Alkalihalophilus pseudofirmus]|uniref:S-layer homology domain-containing protein n=1 Tax=Alkalihalophilus pseudofirmus TaxID=79885 RepID=A0AAJ2NQ25_ALKPS|nr:S-layer homology domain-containing protein [Alkalihalophilus pseudofirmus]MDV2886383.1 S-layer homology domain-containing protein [Alkalihalophilus pseudofirmus]